MSDSSKIPPDPSRKLQDHESTLSAAAYSPRLNVLVIDDDIELTAMLEGLLTSSGYQVVCARSVFMAHEAMAEQTFQIVIIDRGLEDGDGIRLCTEIRQRPSLGYVYIMLLTARDSRADVVAGLQAGADDYLSKNKLSESELVARLNTASRIVRLERSLREALSERAPVTTTDVLAGGPNRRQFVKQLARALEQSTQSQRPLSILIMDIDHFKTVNDRHGHVAGDELLRHMANRVRFALPHDQDWIARIGGEEFVVVLPGTSIQEAHVIADRLRGVVGATAFHVAGVDINITISIGLSSIATLASDESITAQALIDQADQYLYRSKLAGRNRVSAPEY